MLQVTAQEEKVSKIAQLVDTETRQDTSKHVQTTYGLLKGLESPITRLADQTVVSSRLLEESRHLKLLRWLSSVPFSRHHESHSDKRIANSGEWLFTHPQYLSWNRSSSSSVLLLRGVLGSGKTVLASSVVDASSRACSHVASQANVAYFYCTRNGFEPERSDPEEVMRSLVRQLTVNNDSQRRIHENLLIEYERREAEARLDGFEIPKLRAADCTRLILEIIETNPAVLIIDAVDELQANRRHELLCSLHQITADSANVVKILLTSRNESNVTGLLSDCQEICITSSDSQADMQLFVRHHLDFAIQNRRLLSGRVSEVLREDLVRSLINGAEQM